MRKVQGLTEWSELRKKLLQDKNYKKVYEEMKPKYELANSLIEFRLKKQLSQRKLAEKIGTKQPVISRLETMTAEPTISLLNRISKILNVKLRIYFQA